jgi:hypothetical protein
MPSDAAGGLCRPLPGTLWIRYDSRTGIYGLSFKGQAWQTTVQQYLGKPLGEAPKTGAGGYRRWRTEDRSVMIGAAQAMADAQGVSNGTEIV